MTKREAADRLHEIGDLFVAAPGEDYEAFRERGLALGLAVGLMLAMSDQEFEERWEVMEALAARGSKFRRAH